MKHATRQKLDAQRFGRLHAQLRARLIARRLPETHRGAGHHRRAARDVPELRLSRLLDEYRQTREERLKSRIGRKQL